MNQLLNIQSFGKSFLQQCGSETLELIDPLLQTASQNPRGLLAISGGFTALSGAQILRASHVPTAVYSWFWQNENQEIPAPRWGMAIIGASSICLGACAVAMAILGFSDSIFTHSKEPGLRESAVVYCDSAKGAESVISSDSLIDESEPDRCEPMELKNSLPKEFSYLFHPGHHARGVSPIVEARADEYQMICDAVRHPTHGQIFQELAQNLYYNDHTSTFVFTMIEPKRCGEAALLADQLYSRFLDPYRCFGVNEANAVHYEIMPSCGYTPSGVVREYLQCGNTENGRKCDFLSLVKVCKGQLRPPHEPGFCFPDSLIAVHELMHTTELPVMVSGDRNSGVFRIASEIMTTTKGIINADEIAKKLDGVDLSIERDYEQKSYSISGCKILLGKFANFYRELEKEEKSLAQALVSEKSIRFLTCADVPSKDSSSST